MRQEVRRLVVDLGFGTTDVTSIVTAVSEICRNMIVYAGGGEFVVRTIRSAGELGIEAVARDSGPGIPDVPRALMDGFSTSGGLGMGLPGGRRLMDEFDIRSKPGDGTVVIGRKWPGRE